MERDSSKITPPSSTRSSRSSTRQLHSLESRVSIASIMVLDDCPICLNGMQQTDYDHLLQCEHHCGFNMCKNCIESLLASSKDDFQEASDGNRHVKVYLHCPNCRSDLSQTIRDTLLLRKADEIILSTTQPSEWSPSQILLEKALHTPSVQQAIKQARKLEAEYLGRDDFERSELMMKEDALFVEEWGFEADCVRGVHDSFRAPPPPEPLPREEAVRIDPTLFAGLDFALSEDQRLEVTELMTSGDPARLSEAAEILHTVAQQLLTPTKRSSMPASTKPLTNKGQARTLRKSLTRRSSVFQLIAEAEEAHVGAHSEEKKIHEACDAALRGNIHRSRVAQHRNLERELRLQADFQKRFPLPVRMPKAVEVDLTIPFDMEFVDFTWGGTLLDAYSKISVGFRNSVSQSRPSNANVAKILGNSYVADQSTSTTMGCVVGLCIAEQFNMDDVYIALPGEARVLISHTGHSGKQGAVRGDVLTHIDRVAVAGKDVNHVLMLLHSKRSKGRVMLTLNAERSVAEALKRRAAAIIDM
ncbi:hypothetical protein IV203_016219 [Nitzschia inconspicua]|uniref:RING-type domain-containing protein n=1 Tax=Nitzschia inconspicua TaxID=303405 RepID=A0A9K3KQR5_9STRA|nr:hypothetical protein IV203_016219 [Nitzschia inconspicua]